MIDWVWLIPLFPLCGFLFNGLIGRWMNLDKRIVGWVACAALGLSFLFSVLIFVSLREARSRGHAPRCRIGSSSTGSCPGISRRSSGTRSIPSPSSWPSW